jgi:hypothetical protein
MLKGQQQNSSKNNKAKHLPDFTPNKEVDNYRSEKIKVAIRVRPQLRSEVGKECVCHIGKSVSCKCFYFIG